MPKYSLLLAFIAAVLASVNAYIYYPLAPKALYQEGMNVSFVSGRFGFYQESPGFGADGIYNGVLGVTFERTEKFAFLTSADGKKVRKLNYRTTQVGPDITCKRIVESNRIIDACYLNIFDNSC
jgi:hypothetical protein